MRLLPRPYPDEAVGSILLRAKQRMGLGLSPALQWIYDSPGRSSASFLLDADNNRLAAMCGMPGGEFLDRHTIFPYTSAYHSPESKAKLRESLMTCSDRRAKSISPLVANAVTRGWRRFCPYCLEDDLKAFGESYWRRSHQIATVLVCRHHNSPLREAIGCSPATLVSRGALLPHEVCLENTSLPLKMSMARALAKLSEDLLMSDLQDVCVLTQRDLVALARKKGFVHPHGGLATGLIASSLAKTYGFNFLDQLGHQFCPTDDLAWPALLLRRSCYPASTIRHVLLQAFLMHASISDADHGSLLRRKYPQRDYAALDEQMAHRLCQEIEKLQRKNTITTAASLISSTGHSGTYRHNRYRMPLSVSIVEHFKRSSLSIRKLRSSANKAQAGVVL